MSLITRFSPLPFFLSPCLPCPSPAPVCFSPAGPSVSCASGGGGERVWPAVSRPFPPQVQPDCGRLLDGQLYNSDQCGGRRGPDVGRRGFPRCAVAQWVPGLRLQRQLPDSGACA